MCRLTTAAVTAFGLACGAGDVRPYLRPFPDAVVDTLRADPESVIRELTQVVGGEGIAPRVASPEEGYLETVWFDARADDAGGAAAQHLGTRVRLRFWVDPIGGGEVQVVAEAVARRTVDPSLPVRETEVMVPSGHPGYRVLERVLDAVRSRLGNPRTAGGKSR